MTAGPGPAARGSRAVPGRPRPLLAAGPGGCLAPAIGTACSPSALRVASARGSVGSPPRGYPGGWYPATCPGLLPGPVTVGGLYPLLVQGTADPASRPAIASVAAADAGGS